MSDNEKELEPRNKPVTMYYTAEEKAAIKREAEQAGKTVSTYCRDIIDRKRREDNLEHLDAEQRFDRLMAESTDRIEEIAEDIREQNNLVIHIPREIESQVEGVDVNDAAENVDNKAESVDDLL